MSTLLRLATAGSVDDGKSTLVGRLLHDSKSVLADQLDAVERVSRDRGLASADLALLTDGLRAEREQGITIDVAYRYFATAARSFVLADCPGHVQYTRNTVTGSSTADALVLLVDARKGVLEQTRRHLAVAALMRVPHVVIAVNKIDLDDPSEDVFRTLAAQVRAVAVELGIPDAHAVPVSALVGDNVVDRSERTPWYDGPSLLYHLEHVHIASDRNLIDCRFPVQWVIRPMTDEHHDYRGYAGNVASGVFKPGDEVVVLPSGKQTRIKQIDSFDGPVEEAFPPLSITMLLEDEIDISRGDYIVRAHNQPTPTREFDAMVAWLNDKPMDVRGRYAIKHTTRSAKAVVEELRYRVDVNTLHRDEQATSLKLNEIGRVKVRTSSPLLVDEYRRNRTTGSFILIDEGTNETVGAGMVLETDDTSHDVAD